jgi:hypothetical protein
VVVAKGVAPTTTPEVADGEPPQCQRREDVFVIVVCAQGLLLGILLKRVDASVTGGVDRTLVRGVEL